MWLINEGEIQKVYLRRLLKQSITAGLGPCIVRPSKRIHYLYTKFLECFIVSLYLTNITVDKEQSLIRIADVTKWLWSSSV